MTALLSDYCVANFNYKIVGVSPGSQIPGLTSKDSARYWNQRDQNRKARSKKRLATASLLGGTGLGAGLGVLAVNALDKNKNLSAVKGLSVLGGATLAGALPGAIYRHRVGRKNPETTQPYNFRMKGIPPFQMMLRP